MITNLHNITCLNNLGKKGQIATLLILMMVAVLIFILVTVNIGQVSTVATTLANAADSGALSLGSQLATKANGINEILKKAGEAKGAKYSKGPPPRVYKKGGWLVFISSVICGPLGPLGGYLAGYIQYGGEEGAKQGAAEGAQIGATIASWAASGAMLGSQFCPVYGTAIGAGIGVGVGIYMAYQNQLTKERMTVKAFDATAKNLSKIPEKDRYRESVFLQVFSETIDDPNDTPDVNDSDDDGNKTEMVSYFQYWWERRIDSLAKIIPALKVYIQAFLDGPLTTFEDAIEGYSYYDDCHSTVETDQGSKCVGKWVYVPGLLDYLAREETEGLDAEIAELASALYDAGYGDEISFWQPGTPSPDAEDYLDRLDKIASELSYFLDDAEALKSEDTTQLASSWHTWLKDFYDPVPPEWAPDTPEEEEANADWCDVFENGIKAEPEGWKSEIETVRDSLPDSELSYTSGALAITNSPSKIYQERKNEFNAEIDNTDYFLAHWGWSMFGITCPAGGSCYGLSITGIKLSDGLIYYDYKYTYDPPEGEPISVTGGGTYDIDSSPAGSGLAIAKSSLTHFTAGVAAFDGFVNSIGHEYATIDGDTDDEFVPAIAEIDKFIARISASIDVFQLACSQLDTDLTKKYAEMDTDYGGLNPAIYTWTDSRGDHSIRVEVGKYKTAGTKKKTKEEWWSWRGMAKRYYLYLIDYKDIDGKNCWVKVTRKDPADRDAGILGKWNPYDNDDPDDPDDSVDDGELSITRTSKVAYSYDYVEMKYIR